MEGLCIAWHMWTLEDNLWALVLLSTMCTQKSDSGHLAWHQAPLPTKPSPQPFQCIDTFCSVSPMGQPFSSPSSLSLCLPLNHSEYETDADLDLYILVHMCAVLLKHCLGTVIHRSYLVISRTLTLRVLATALLPETKKMIQTF